VAVLWLCVVVAVVIAGAVVSVRAGQTASEVPDLEGGWVRLDTAGSGSFGGLASTFRPAWLTAEGLALTTAQPAAQAPRFDFASGAPKGVGEAYIVTDGRCGQPGGVEPNSAAWHMVQTADEVLIVRENPDPGRHIFMDGRLHPDLARWIPSANGHSTGRYERGELVVETVGLTAGAVTAGGRRTPQTRLTERFRLAPGGMRLTITYTWEDATLYHTPHTYALEFERVPPGGYAFESWCDSSDPKQRESIVPPAQRP
jgi:hypothetical protein